MSYAVMPMADYRSICDKVREKTETTEAIKSGDMTGKVEEVYKAGQLSVFSSSEALKGKVERNPATITDISHVEHNVGVKLRSKPSFTGLLEGCTFEDTDFGYIRSTPFNVPTEGNYTFALTLADNSKWADWVGDGVNWKADGSPSLNGSSNPSESRPFKIGEYRLYLSARNGLTAADILSGTMESGDNVVAPNPSEEITDFSGVKVLVCGKNLFDKVAWMDYCTGASTEAKLNDVYLGEKCFSYALKKNAGTPNFSEINFKPNTRYVFSMSYSYSYGTEDSRKVGPLVIRYTDGSIQYIETTASSSEFTEFTFTTSANKSVESITFSNWGNLKIYCKWVQIEEGIKATEYEEYKGSEYTSNADGTVEGVKSKYPSMSISSDADVIISAEYYKDIDKVLENLVTDIALSGGE